MYRLLRVHSRMTSNYMIFEVKIPLVNKDSYELHKTITIPQQHGKTSVSIIPTAKYIATNLKKDKIILFHDEDIHRCVHFTERLLCSLLQPIYDLKGSDAICEAQVIINKDKITTCKTELQQYSDKWIQLHRRGAWLYSCRRDCSVRIFCPADMTPATLHGTGLITLGQGCILKNDNFTIHSYNDFHNKMFMNENTAALDIPQINQLINRSNQHLLQPEDHSETLRELKQRIDAVKDEQLKFNGDAQYNNTHHYTLIYCLTAFIAISSVLVGYQKAKRECLRRKTNKVHDGEPSQGDVEMAVLEGAHPPRPAAPPRAPPLPRPHAPGTADKACSPTPQVKHTIS
ncbi:hypothetical protein JYU34_017027 [Plutella xylostella]|uniref:Envelope protein n=1 Tax=Plutella xylostella TaxID=51655 RepID=A0ABQ7Q416_PLUXY|nr:hypothetical protein JYU34_017027 [Plutella xylostella]